MNRSLPIRLVSLWMILLTCAYGQVIAKGVSMSGGLSCGPTNIPIFSPPPGTYSSPQNVTITCPFPGQTAVVRSDGGWVSAASPLYSGPMPTSSTTTYQTECVTYGGTTGNPTYQTNTQATNTGFVCHVGPSGSGSITFPSGVTCTYSGGVGTVTPTNVITTFGTPSTFTITTPSNTSGSETQALFVYQYGGSLDPSASTCDTCTSQVKDIKFTVIGSGIANQEFDMPQYDPTHGNTDRQNGTQCQGSSGLIEVDSGNAGGWTQTTASCSSFTNGTTHEVVNRVDHDLTGSCPGGNGCALYKYIWIDGVYTALLGNYSNTQGYNNNSGAAWGWQFQPDMKPTSGTAATGGWNVISSTVALTKGDDTPVVTGTYTIVAPSTATPILIPNAYSTGNYALAASTPTLAFGKQGISTSSPAIPISISNSSNSQYCTLFGIGCGSGSVTVTGMTISGTNASDFTLAGSCSTISSGSDCEPTITFSPTASSGTNETATLTVNYSGATTASQTMSLTGTSATVTTLSTSACPTALSGSTNYQLTADITCAGTAFTFGGTNTDVNLNGHTVTFGNTSSAAQVNGFQASNFTTSLTVHNGTIASGAGTNTKGAGHPQSSSIGYTGSFNMASGLTIFNTTFNYNIQFSNAIEDNNGNLVAHDNLFEDTAVGNCSNVGCRAELYATPIYQENVSTVTSGGTHIYNNTLSGGPQGGIDCAAPGCIVDHNSVNPGNATGNNTNDFAIYAWGNAAQVYDNAIGTPQTAGSNTRGIQISAAQTPTITNANVYNNLVQSIETPTNLEYSGCQHGGTFGSQIDDNPIGPNTLNGNIVTSYAKGCAAQALRLTASSYTTNVSENSTYTAVRQAGATTCASGTWTEAENGCAYALGIDGTLADSTIGDIYTGDNGDLFFGPDGAPGTSGGIFIKSPTFNKGTNPGTFWHFLVAQNGPGSANQIANVHVVDPTFGAGVSFTDTQIYAQGTNNGPVSVYEDWTQTMTVTKASGPAAVGAVVTWTDTLSNTYTCTTNSSGVCTVALTQYRDNNDTGANQVENRNPYSLSIPFSGCSTYTQSGVTISATGSRSITLSGC